jgi:malic enzyme
MAAVKLRWPRALIQFEDFQSKHAIATLKRYRKEYLMFNDDIQVTVRENCVNVKYYDHRNI